VWVVFIFYYKKVQNERIVGVLVISKTPRAYENVHERTGGSHEEVGDFLFCCVFCWN
jgi:hypothetical protein